MYIQKIKLQNFRNYEFAEIELYEGTNIFFRRQRTRKNKYFRSDFYK